MKYRRRIPKALLEYVDKQEIKRVVSSKSEAVAIDTQVANALKIAKGDFTELTKRALIKEELGAYLELKVEEESLRYADAAKMYLDQSSVSPREYTNRLYFFNDMLPSLLEYVYRKNPILSEVTSLHLNEIAMILQRLPSRNHHDLKRITSLNIIRGTMQGAYDEHKKLHVDTVNKQIKRIRSLALYGFRTGLFSLTTAIQTVKHHYSAREQRKALTLEEVGILCHASKTHELRAFIKILYLTGMRVGEVGKFKMTVVNGIECFDLRDADSLKTRSSFRIIPRHPDIETVEFYYTLEHLARQVKLLINDNLNDTEKKTTYSLRHTFASELIVKNVRSDIVSELLGHKHLGMTLSRYAKGFSVEQLNEAILKL